MLLLQHGSADCCTMSVDTQQRYKSKFNEVHVGTFARQVNIIIAGNDICHDMEYDVTPELRKADGHC